MKTGWLSAMLVDSPMETLAMRQMTVAGTVILVLTLFGTAASADQPQLVRTSQMWGTEVREGKIQAHIGIAAECVQDTDRRLTCQFVSITTGSSGDCAVVTWSLHLTLVRQTADVVTWAGSAGPSGLVGVLTAATLTAQRSPNASAEAFKRDGPGSLDTWHFRSTQTHSAPIAPGRKILPPVTTDTMTGGSTPRDTVCPLGLGRTMIFANSPLVSY